MVIARPPLSSIVRSTGDLLPCGLILSANSRPGPKRARPRRRANSSRQEAVLQVALPTPLNDLLREADGIAGEHGLGLVWPVARIVSDNLDFRTRRDFRSLYMPFDPLLFFADAGNGDQFAFIITDGEIRRNDVFCWNHENDTRAWVAPGLREYLEWWLLGKLEL